MSYKEAKAKYAAIGVDTDAAIARLKTIPVSLHCWQGDDVRALTPTRISHLPEAYRPPATIPAGQERRRSLWQTSTRLFPLFPVV